MQGTIGQNRIIKLEDTQPFQPPPKQTNKQICLKCLDCYVERKDIPKLGILRNIPMPQRNEQKENQQIHMEVF